MSTNPASSPRSSSTGLHFEEYGSGDPILAIHGLGASVYTWRKLKGRLPDHKLILIDLKGHGESPKPHDKNYSIADHAELVLQFIREQDLKNLTLMGNSYGGAVSLDGCDPTLQGGAGAAVKTDPDRQRRLQSGFAVAS